MGVELLTERLLLRPLRVPDAPAVFAYRSDPEVSRYQSWEPQSVAEVQAFIEGLADLEPDTPGRWFQMAITLRESGILIGDCGLYPPEGKPHETEVGITLVPAFQRQGYATETLLAVLGYLFERLGKHRVFCSIDPRNHASLALMQRVGLRQEAHFVESFWFKGAWADDLIYAMLAREWQALAAVS